MTASRGDVLISGASVAGPTLAYWLHRHGFRVTVVERSPALRRGWGGHGVDLFGPAVDIVDRMGILPKVWEARTRTETISTSGASAVMIPEHAVPWPTTSTGSARSLIRNSSPSRSTATDRTSRPWTAG